MQYQKPPLSYQDQIVLFKSRGLHIGNEDVALHYQLLPFKRVLQALSKLRLF